MGATLLGMASMPSSALACSACFGRSDDAMAQGMNMGIFTLLIVIMLVLGGIAAFAVFLAVRSARMANGAPNPTFPSDLSAPVSEQIPKQPLSHFHGTAH
jgi:hypothetical protein